LGPCVFILIF